MKTAVIAAFALVLGAASVARADQVIILNSEEASYSVLSRGLRAEIARVPTRSSSSIPRRRRTAC